MPLVCATPILLLGLVSYLDLALGGDGVGVRFRQEVLHKVVVQEGSTLCAHKGDTYTTRSCTQTHEAGREAGGRVGGREGGKEGGIKEGGGEGATSWSRSRPRSR